MDKGKETVPVKPIILLSGPVGAGKSTVANQLIALMAEPKAMIEGDKFWSFLDHGKQNMCRPKNFRTIMAAMIAASVPFAHAGYHTLVDFSIPPWFLQTARSIADKGRGIQFDYIILRPELSVCASRAAARPLGAVADYGPYQDLYASFDGFERHTIRGEGSAGYVAAFIQQGLEEGLYRLEN